MMNAAPAVQKPADEDERRKAREETAQSFLAQASAGTGKTSVLIGRILHLVLEKGPTGPPLPLSNICAITFTEKAAGEMKVRLRQEFEHILRNNRTSDVKCDRARAALNDLETAAISTIHSLAVSLLKERPIEAKLDPQFTVLNEIESELFFRKTWESWIGRALEQRVPTLERGLRNGFRLETLENLARTLRLKWLTVRDLECDSPPAEDRLSERIHDFQNRGKAFLSQAATRKDKLAGCLEAALNWLDNPLDQTVRLSKPRNAGSASNWEGGKATVQAVQKFIRETVEMRAFYENMPGLRLLDDVVRWIQNDFLTNEWENRKRAEGLLDFDDQLRYARDLLKNPVVRRGFQDRYHTLLVDEFQDTDAVQWEIILLLSSKDVEETDLAKLRPAPGRLFLVGDPKQSIYRFRNADIETYLGIANPDRMKSLELEELKLTTNFRSVPSILRFVDAAFASVMQQSDYQADYQPFGKCGYRKEASDSPAVHVLGDKHSEGGPKRTVREFIKLESDRVAKLIHRIQGSESWKIQDQDKQDRNGRRVPRYGDVAVLLPVLTHTDILEDALRDNGIPYVLEGGKFYYARSEVSSAITVLRAIANPNDAVALYGSLRSIFFGLSDEDLLRAHIQGVPLDYRGTVPCESPLHHPYEILRNLHRHRNERPASETLEALMNATGAREVLAVSGFQSLANLNKLVRTLRALQREATFSQVVDLISMIDEEGLAESESRLMEERGNAVRLMSIHKAKGLDFPIVIVAALGLGKRGRSNSILADAHQKKSFALNISLKDSSLRTTSWEELSKEEKRKEDAELVRLLYVALTRARDHLILSTHTSGWKQSEDGGRWVPATAGTRLEPLDSFLSDCLSGESTLVHVIDVDDLDREAGPHNASSFLPERDWQGIAKREYSELRALLGNTPASRKLRAAGQAACEFQPEDGAPEDRLSDAVEKRAVRLGLAFHEAMERVDFFSLDGPPRWIRDMATRHKLDAESSRTLEKMIRICLNSHLLERARTAARSGRRLFREMPFVRSLENGTVEEGKIDLLFEEPEGWVLVDYKTDWVRKDAGNAEEFFRDKYANQIKEYAAALHELSLTVQCAYLLLARTGAAVRII